MPAQIAGSMLVSVVNPDGTAVGGGVGGGGSVTIDGQPISVTVADEPIDVTVVGQPISTTATGQTHVLVDNASVPITVDGQPISIAPTGQTHVLVDSQPIDVTLTGQPITTNTTIVGQPVQTTPLGDSFVTTNAVGSAVNPIGGTTIVTTTIPATGRYRVVVEMMLSGTGIPTTPHNYNLQVALTPQLRLFVPTAREVTYTTEHLLDATAGQTIRVFATGNEPSGVVATGIINLYRQV